MKKFLENVRIWILVLFLILQEYLTERILNHLWLTSSNLLWYFFFIFYKDTLWYLVFVFLFLKYNEYSDDEGRLFKRNKDKVPGSPWKDKIGRKFMLALWGVLAVISVIGNLTPTKLNYSNIRIDDQKISKLEYKYRILSDWVSDNIVTENFSSEKVYARSISYTVRRSNRFAAGARTEFSRYIVFKNEDDTHSIYPLDYVFFKYMIERQKESVPSFTITYYKKSGVVVAVDGYTVNDLKRQYETK